MKIAFLIRSLGRGGSERQLATLAGGLRERGHDVLVIVCYGGGPYEAAVQQAGVPVRHLGQQSRWGIGPALLRLARLVRRERPDVLHGYLDLGNLLALALKPVFPRVRVVWGVRASNVDRRRYPWTWRVAFRLQCLLSGLPDLVVLNSAAGREYHAARGFPGRKMIVIPNGIDTSRFRPDPRAGRAVRAAWGIREDDVVIGVVGRLDPMKDHPTFLRAAALLASERRDVRFVCAGDGPPRYRHRLEALGQELGLAQRLVWAGAVDDVTGVYNVLDIACSASSDGEGFSNVIAEAMACGVPCVVTDVGDSAAIVGDAGLVVPPGDPRALAAAWRDLLDRPRARRLELGRRARDRVIRLFGRERLVERTEAALATLIESGPVHEPAGADGAGQGGRAAPEVRAGVAREP